MTHRVLVTGAAGYLGSKRSSSRSRAGCAQTASSGGTPSVARLVATDVREIPVEKHAGVEYVAFDVRARGLAQLLSSHAIDTVVHLAAIVTPGPTSNRELEYSVDVLGTRNVLEACVETGVGRIIVTSSGAAYGYHADSPAWLTEDDPVRGNTDSFWRKHSKC